MPQSLKKKGALVLNTLTSQKTANPPHNKLNGIKRPSAARSTTPCLGRPDQSKFSLGPSSALSICSTLCDASTIISELDIKSPLLLCANKLLEYAVLRRLLQAISLI